jgi:hypothetical protein
VDSFATQLNQKGRDGVYLKYPANVSNIEQTRVLETVICLTGQIETTGGRETPAALQMETRPFGMIMTTLVRDDSRVYSALDGGRLWMRRGGANPVGKSVIH